MKYPSKEQVERLRSLYPPGTRIELTGTMDDPYSPVPAGTCGTVRDVVSDGGVEMIWDNHSALKLLPDVDTFRIIRYT